MMNITQKSITMGAFLVMICPSVYSTDYFRKQAERDIIYEEAQEREARIQARAESLKQEHAEALAAIFGAAWYVTASTVKFVVKAVTNPNQAVKDVKDCKAEDITGFIGSAAAIGTGVCLYVLNQEQQRNRH